MGNLVFPDIPETDNYVPVECFYCLQLVDATVYSIFVQRELSLEDNTLGKFYERHQHQVWRDNCLS